MQDSCTKKGSIVSQLEIVHISDGKCSVLAEFDYLIEAPNWLQDGRLLYNSKGHIYYFDPETKKSSQIDTGYCDACNNDHVLSPDQKILAVSNQTKEDNLSRIYLISLTQKTSPKLVTPLGPSYLHGYSKDGKTLAYCAMRNGQFDIYTTSIESGEEYQLTNFPSLDDGPEYSPDGRYIWFNSTRSGLMQIWRMETDGSLPVQMTFEKRNNWFPHLSPDGRYVAYLSYNTDEVTPEEHPANKNVEIRLMSTQGGSYQTLVKLLGGQGTINVNSWSPDGTQLAFVRYRFHA